MSSVILTFHFIICIFLIIVVLLQAGKGADIGATFGGGGSQTVFGPRGAATLLSKITTGAAILFLLTSIILAGLARQESQNSVISGAKLPPPAVAETQKAETQEAAESQKADEVKSKAPAIEADPVPAAEGEKKPLTGKKKTGSGE